MKNEAEMITNGWIICINNGHTEAANLNYKKRCSSFKSEGFWGYSYGCPIGEAKAQFEGFGKATLSFGNCHWEGTTKVYLNNKIIKTSGSNQSEVVSFEYKSW